MRKIEIKILILVVAFFILLSNVNESYARYISSSSADTSADFKTWKILVNNTDITNNYSTTMNFTPTIISSSNVRGRKLAPGSTGYIDILVDSSSVKTPYRMTMDTTKFGSIDNFKVIGYSNGSTANPDVSFVSDTGTYPDSKTTIIDYPLPTSGNFSNYHIRIFFKWINNYNNTSTDSSDTAVGEAVSNSQSVECGFTVNLVFSQILLR